MATVQEALETALTRIAGAPIVVAASGRTDAGVHASGQVVSFASPVERPPRAWLRGTQSVSPPGISVQWALQVEPEFHARFSATSRRYQYLWLEAPVPPAFGAAHVAWIRDHLEAGAMHTAAQILLGEHDFSTFRAASCQSHTAYRCVQDICVRRIGDFVVLDIAANAFLHHMVRNIAGTLQEVGRGGGDAAWVRDLLTARDRSRAPRTAPPTGLYLVDVRYGELPIPSGTPPLLLRAATIR
jgi:tRNA pseudouridine38-40 synthase